MSKYFCKQVHFLSRQERVSLTTLMSVVSVSLFLTLIRYLHTAMFLHKTKKNVYVIDLKRSPQHKKQIWYPINQSFSKVDPTNETVETLTNWHFLLKRNKLCLEHKFYYEKQQKLPKKFLKICNSILLFYSELRSHWYMM